jgi:hypothetical protein
VPAIKHQGSEVSAWLAGICCLGQTKQDRQASRQLFDVLTRSGVPDEKTAAAEITYWSGDTVAVVRWLRGRAVRLDDSCSEHAAGLLRAMSCSTDLTEREAARPLLEDRDRDWGLIALWLAEQMLLNPRSSIAFKTAKTCLESMVKPPSGRSRSSTIKKPKIAGGGKVAWWEKEDARYLAAVEAIVWMVQHTLPADLIADDRFPHLLTSLTEPAAGEWAARVFDRHLLRYYLSHDRWWSIRKRSKIEFGFDFADEAVSLVWRRLGSYQLAKTGFFAWVYTVVSRYWAELHRKGRLAAMEEAEGLTPLDDRSDDKTPPPDRDAAPIGLSPFNLAELKRWEPIDSLLFTCELGLWDQIPEELWLQWLAKFRINARTMRRRLPRLTKPKERRALLAELTKIKPNALAQRWRRLQPRLESLQPINTLE